MSEKKHVKKDGASPQINSGRHSHSKGDATMMTPTGLYVVDYKEYGTSFGLSRQVWARISTDAMKVNIGSEPVIKLVLGGQLELAVHHWSWFMALANKEV